jgi:uncharacterized protein YifE (UPF0438 family)
MNATHEHEIELARTGYTLPPGGDFTDQERATLVRYGHWMAALAAGRLEPQTADQRHFVDMCRGEVEPSTPFEWAWVKLQLVLNPPRVPTPAELSSLAQRLQQAREAALEAQLVHAEKRRQILNTVQAELDALDAADAPRLEALDREFTRLQEELKQAVLSRGATFAQGGLKAVFYPGRVTYDAKAMEAYAQAHPEVCQYKKVGKPFVQLRFGDAPQAPSQ